MAIEAVFAALLFVSALSLDALVAAFGYGASKVKIPFGSAIVINLICSGALAASLYAGKALGSLLSRGLCTEICVSLLLFLGVIKLSESLKRGARAFPVGRFNSGGCEKYLSLKEAAPLAAALSLDGAAAGVGYGLTNINYIMIIGFSFITGAAAIALGGFIGGKIAQKTPLNLNWLSGVILIGLAVSKLLR